MKGQVTDGQWTVTAENVLDYILCEMSHLRWSCSDLTFAEKSAKFEAIIAMYRGLASAALMAQEEAVKKEQADASASDDASDNKEAQ